MAYPTLQEQHNENQLELSMELLHLLAWMVEHEQPFLKKAIKKAVKKGLYRTINNTAAPENIYQEPEALASMQYNVMNFFTTLEELLHKTMAEDSMEKVARQELLPTVDQIDIEACDWATVGHTIARTADHLEDNPHANPRETLLRELLKQWKPEKKTAIH